MTTTYVEEEEAAAAVSSGPIPTSINRNTMLSIASVTK